MSSSTMPLRSTLAARTLCLLTVVLATLAFALCAGAALPARETVTLVLKDGQVLEGRVADLHGASLEVGRRLGSILIPKREVQRWQLNFEGDTVPESILILRDGDQVAGEVTPVLSEDSWRVKLPIGGEAKYRRSAVARVISRSGVATDGSFTPRPGYDKITQKAIEQVKSEDDIEQGEGRKTLEQIGFFALGALDDAIAALPPDTPPSIRLAQIALRERVRIALPEHATRRDPKLASLLMTGSADERIEAIRTMFFDVGDRIHDLVGVLLLDTAQPAVVRAYCVDLLQRSHRIDVLIDSYERATGKAQLAIAVALGDAGIYAGIGTLIEALGLSGDDAASIAVRKLAADKLEEYTGQRFAFDADGDVGQRNVAIAHFEEWWKSHRAQVLDRLRYELRPDSDDPHRARASRYWQEGTRSWKAGKIDFAEELFRKAIDEDPTCLPPFVSLGILCYQSKGEFERAQEWLGRAIRREAGKGEQELQMLAYYHLGRLAELSLDYELAEGYYRKATGIDPSYADAWMDLGMSIYKDAISSSQLTASARADRLRSAIQVFESGYEKIKEHEESLHFLSSANLPVGGDLPFSSRSHNINLRKAKQRMKQSEAQFAYQLALLHMALSEREKSVRWGEIATQAPKPTIDAHLLLARVYRDLGRTKRADDQLQRAREIDPKHPAVQGLPENKE